MEVVNINKKTTLRVFYLIFRSVSHFFVTFVYSTHWFIKFIVRIFYIVDLQINARIAKSDIIIITRGCPCFLQLHNFYTRICRLITAVPNKEFNKSLSTWKERLKRSGQLFIQSTNAFGYSYATCMTLKTHG